MNNVHFIGLSSYTAPKITQDQNKDWVTYETESGESYFQYLIDNYNGSPTNNAVINGIVGQIYGSGLDAEDKTRKPDQWAELKVLISSDCLRNTITDRKITGQAAMMVTYEAGKQRIKKVSHFPVNTLRAEKANKDGDITGYYYHHDWDNAKPSDKPKRFPAFGYGSKGDVLEILYIKPYALGYFYYSPVDYQGCLPYCELEQEVANYHINNVKNGLTAGAMINFNNGVPDEKQQIDTERKIKQKFTNTSNAGKFILAFNDNKENAATIETLQLGEAHQQYSFLSEESTRKIMVGHRVTSPMLLGIKDNTGLGNNAEELETAQELFDTTVLKPFRIELIESFKRILAYNKISLDIYFRPLSKGDVNDINSISQDEVTKSEVSYNGAQISSALDIIAKVKEGILTEKQAKVFLIQFLNLDPKITDRLFSENEDIDVQEIAETALSDDRPFLKDELANGIIAELEELGELESDLLNDYEMIESEDAEDEPEEFNAESYLNSREDFAAQQDSEQDTERYKVRYVYQKGTRKQPKGETRPLCNALINAGRVYRKEDIQKLSSKGGAESKGQAYSVWKYKGGANCYHRWERRVYRKKLNKAGEPWGGGALNGTQKVSVNQAIRQGFKMPQNPKEVAIAPITTPTKGYKK